MGVAQVRAQHVGAEVAAGAAQHGVLIEYDDTTENGNHQHTVLRRPRSDFGADVLGAHLSHAHR